MKLERAVEVFVHAFCAGRSRTYPYVATRMDRLWVMEDTPPRRNPRKIEVVAIDMAAEAVCREIAAHGIGWHFLAHAMPRNPSRSFAEVRAEYKAAGYRALGTEWFFVHDLARIPTFESNPPAKRVETEDQLQHIRQRASHKRGLRPGARVYAVWDADGDIGWVTSVPYGADAWVSDLYVYREFRRQGYGKALMSRLLRDDREAGFSKSILLASSAGSKLYPKLGYEEIGTLQIFCPAKRPKTAILTS